MDEEIKDLTEYEIITYETINPGVVGADATDNIFFTTKATDILEQEIADYLVIKEDASTQEYYIRFHTKSSPQQAKQFMISIDNQVGEFDKIFNLRNLNVVIDRKSLFYFMGMVVDYIKNEEDEGFVFYEQDNE